MKCTSKSSLACNAIYLTILSQQVFEKFVFNIKSTYFIHQFSQATRKKNSDVKELNTEYKALSEISGYSKNENIYVNI